MISTPSNLATMEELKRLHSSRRGYRAHLSKTLSSVAEILEGDLTTPLRELDVVLLTNTLEQLQQKKEILCDLDKKIADRITDESELESEVFKAEEQETLLLDNITKIKFFLRPQRPPVNAPPVDVQSSSNPRSKVTPLQTETHSEPPSIPATGIDSSHMSNSSNQQNLLVPLIDVPDQPISLEASNHTTQPIPDPVSTHVPVSVNDTVTSSATAQPHSSYNVSRLPKLNMPFYAGDPLLWQSFWDCFDAAINSNPTLTGVQKLTYPQAQLQGDAAGVIAGFPLTNANYSHSIALLQSRFGQPHKLVSVHMQALLDLPSPVNTLTSLQQFHDSVESHIKKFILTG